jgi:Na+-transporting NADH:ubiquinone oxidoreductase subunit NqrD
MNRATQKLYLIVVAMLLLICSSVDVAFANPVPWSPYNSFLNLEPLEYVSIIVAEFCGIVVGMRILIHSEGTRWRKAAVVMLIASLASYFLGIAVWTLSYRSGILDYRAVMVVMLLPELFGTVVGSVVIHMIAKVGWKISTIAMAAAMFTSFLIGLLLSAKTLVIV